MNRFDGVDSRSIWTGAPGAGAVSIIVNFDRPGTATLRVVGQPSLNEVIRAAETVYSDPRFDTPSRLLWDFSEGGITLGAEELRRFADFVRTNRPPGPGKAAICASDELSFGLSRLYELSTDDIPVEVAVFRDLQSALSWLNEPFQ